MAMATAPRVLVVGGGPVGLACASLLSRYGVQCTLVERREGRRRELLRRGRRRGGRHPQAHFISARSMEMFRELPGGHALCARLREAMPPREQWKDFVFCHAVRGDGAADQEFARVDHFAQEAPWREEVRADALLRSHEDVGHLSQPLLEDMLLENLLQHCGDMVTFVDGAELMTLNKGVQGHGKRVEAQVLVRAEGQADETMVLHPEYVVAADGAHSVVRKQCGIHWRGEREVLQHLVNVHFVASAPVVTRNPAMLYFVFNEHTVCVFVLHNAERNEWVCQIPYYPPHQTREEFTPARCKAILEHGIIAAGAGDGDWAGMPQLEVRSVQFWEMHAQVAASMCGLNSRVLLAGDAAHRFPPAGGLGMNTGLIDAHNLSWRLASVLRGGEQMDKERGDEAGRLLDAYNAERLAAAWASCNLAMKNYQRTLDSAATLGASASALSVVTNVLGDESPLSALLPRFVRHGATRAALHIGKAPFGSPQWRRAGARRLREHIHCGGGLPLIFPRHDLGHSYAAHEETQECVRAARALGAARSESRLGSIGSVRVGCRLPHAQLRWRQPPSAQETRSTSITHIAADAQALQKEAWGQHPTFALIVSFRECIQSAEEILCRTQSLAETARKVLRTAYGSHIADACLQPILVLGPTANEDTGEAVSVPVAVDETGDWLQSLFGDEKEKDSGGGSGQGYGDDELALGVLVRPDGHVCCVLTPTDN